MTKTRLPSLTLAVLLAGAIWSAPQTTPVKAPEVLQLSGDIENVDDPVIIKEGDTYYIYCTGGRPGQGIIPIRTSRDLRTCTLAGYVMEKLPDWAASEIPKATGAWAPDISLYGRQVSSVLRGFLIRQQELGHRVDDQ